MNGFLGVLSLDIIRGWRKLKKSTLSSPLATLWFLFLMFIGEFFILQLFKISTLGLITPGGVTLGRILILLSLFFFIKSDYQFKRELLSEGPFQTLAVTRGGVHFLKWEKLLYLLIVNYLLYLFFLIPFSYLSLMERIQFKITKEGVFLLFSLPIINTVAGATLSAGRYLLNCFKNIFYYSFLSAPVAVSYYLLEKYNSNWGYEGFLPLLVLQLIFFDAVFLKREDVDSITLTGNRLSSNLRPINFRWEGENRIGSLAGFWWGLRRRKHDIFGSISSFIIIFGAEIYLALKTPAEMVIGRGEVVRSIMRASAPATAAFFIYIISSLEVLIPTMLFLGDNENYLWLFRSSPINEVEIIKGRMRAQLLLTPLIIPTALLPFAVLKVFPPLLTVMMIGSCVLMIYLSSVVGLWASVKYRKEVVRGEGYPPVVPMYSTLMITLILFALYEVLGGFLYIINPLYSVLFMWISAALCYPIYNKSIGYVTESLRNEDV